MLPSRLRGTGAAGRLEGGVGVTVEPAVEVSGVEDDGHAVVNRSHQLFSVGGDEVEIEDSWRQAIACQQGVCSWDRSSGALGPQGTFAQNT